MYDGWTGYIDNYRRLSKNQVINCSYVLYGEPGTGKSTFAANIARLFGYDMYIVNDYVENRLAYEKRSVILIEELDKILNDNGDFTIKDVEISVMLQYLDGNLRPKNSIFFITCNNIDKLRANKFLSRPGRIDEFIQFGAIDLESCKNVCDLYYPVSDVNLLWEKIDKKATIGMLSSYLKICSIKGISFRDAVLGVNAGMRKHTGGDKHMYH